MLKVSSRGHYGLRLMTELARAEGLGPLSLTEVARVESLPLPYLEQLVVPLRRTGLVEGTRGLHGGYKLSRGATEITVGEVMRVLERGLTAMKFFPAGPAGGPAYLAAIGAPIPQVQFCPTGGVGVDSAPDYLALPNVACVGGSWLTPRGAVEAHDWKQITLLAQGAAALRVH